MDDILQKSIFKKTIGPSDRQIQYLVELYSQGQLQQALIETNKILQQHPNSVTSYNIQGAVNAGLQNFDAAIESYLKAIELKPDFSEAYNNMGVAQQNKGQFKSAIESYKQAILININYAEAYNNIGKCYMKINNFKEAINYYKQAIKVKPDYFEVYNNLGFILQKNGELRTAIKYYKQALNINPNLYEIYNNMGVALHHKGDIVKAIDCFKKAIKTNINYAEAYSNLGNCLKSQKNIIEAIDCYNKAININPNYAEVYNDLGNCFKDQGYLDKAIDCYKNAIKINPNYFESYNNIGNSYLDRGELDIALDYYKYAHRINPHFPEVYNNIGIAFMNKGDLDSAISNYEQALELNPNYVDANFNLATVLFKVGQYKKSADLFKKDHSSKSQNALLQCLHELDDKTLFLEQLDFLINKGENNAVIGSYVSRSNIKYGLSKSNPFCNEPLKYVFKNDLIPESDFKNIFIKGANDILNDERVKEKDQSLITNGIQTAGNIFTHLGEVTNEIKDVIHKEIEKYKLHFKGSEEGIIKSWPEQYELYGWLVSMKNGGELAPHMHEQGWLSGSVYINVPPRVNKDSGNLVLCLDKNNDVKVSSNQSKSVEVVTGNICLFPSSLLHYTIPFEGLEDRVVLAFDVIPQ